MKQIFSMILAMIIIVGFAWLLWLGGKELLTFLQTADSKLGAAIVTAAATILVGVSVAIYSQNRIKTRELEEAHRESKIELYNKFIKKLVEVIAGSNELTSTIVPTEQNLIDFMVEYRRDLLLRASSNVIKAHIEYEKIAAGYPSDGKKLFQSVDKLILEMRKDIGLSNFGLNSMETIQIFLKDKSEINKLK
ncbi:MAG: hypothetical protein R8G66_26830 [Cytophagales bacterium]|nr:hypothetical protein [Cytophagales bacterium]